MAVKIRVLVVDDSAVIRRYVTQILEADSRIEVVGMARDGQDALQRVAELKPDVITLDINMPNMDGITALQYIMDRHPCAVIMLSSLTQQGAIATFEALHLGAFDFLEKPGGTKSTDFSAAELIDKVIEAGLSHKRGQRKRSSGALPAKQQMSVAKSSILDETIFRRVVVIGVSTGGPNTLMDILPHFPADFPAPVVVIQHMPANFTKPFAERLNRSLPLQVMEVEHKTPLKAGTIYIARGGKHLRIEKALRGHELLCMVSDFPTGALHTPSVDVTMLSLVQSFPAKQIIGVILTGIGRDGVEGLLAIRNGGGATIAEAESTAVVYGMPRVAAEVGAAQHILPSHQIGALIVDLIGRAYSKHGS